MQTRINLYIRRINIYVLTKVSSPRRLTEDSEQRVRAMECLDVCSPKFSFSRSVEAVRRQSSRMLCDVLLDQAVMPGVGNIIKNEALFDSGLHPTVTVRREVGGCELCSAEEERQGYKVDSCTN